MDTTTAPAPPRGWLARRRHDKILLAEQAALAQARIAREAARAEADVAETRRRADGRQRAEQDARRETDATRERAERLATRARRLTGVAAAVSMSSLLVTAAGQIMFYTSMPWEGVYRVIAFVLFLFVEGPAWYFALNARDLADREKSYAWSARRVWFFATGAFAMNSYHGAIFFHRWDMGLILGLPSLIGPYTWHKHVHRLHVLRLDRSLDAVKAALWRRIHHPLLTWRATRLWAETGGQLPKDRAFLIVYFSAHGHFPGELPKAALDALQQRTDQRAVPAATEPASSAIPVAQEEPPGKHAADDAAAEPSAVTGEQPAADQALPATDHSADVSVTAALDQYLAGLQGNADPALDPALTPAADSDQQRTSTAVPANVQLPAGLTDRRPTRTAPRRITPAKNSRRRPSAAPARGDTRAEIEQFVKDQLAGGTPLEQITGPMVVKQVGCGESTARNILREIKAEMAGAAA